MVSQNHLEACENTDQWTDPHIQIQEGRVGLGLCIFKEIPGKSLRTMGVVEKPRAVEPRPWV